MTEVVNTATGEITAVLSEDAARRLTERIRIAATNYTDTRAKVLQLVDEAKAGSAHVALGYRSWTAYLSDVLSDEPLRLARDERRELVTRLVDEGLTTTAMAPILGVSDETIRQDINHATSKKLEVDPSVPVVRTTTGLDGRERTSVTAGQVKSNPTAMAEANTINAFTAILRRTFKPEHVAALSPRAKRRLIDLLNEAISTLTEGEQP
jgi:hypothetical protein